MNSKVIDIATRWPGLNKNLKKNNKRETTIENLINDLPDSGGYVIYLDEPSGEYILQAGEDLFSLKSLYKLPELLKDKRCEKIFIEDKKAFLELLNTIYDPRPVSFSIPGIEVQYFGSVYIKRQKKKFEQFQFYNVAPIQRLINRGEYIEAEKVMKIFLKEVKTANCFLITMYAGILVKLGKIRESIRVMENFKGEVDDLFKERLAEAYSLNEEYEQAISKIEEMENKSFSSIAIHAFCLSRLQRYDEVLEVTGHIQNLPDDALRCRAISFNFFGLPKEALMELEKVEKQNTDITLKMKSHVLSNLGKYEEAMALLEKVEDKNDYYYNYYKVLLKLNIAILKKDNPEAQDPQALIDNYEKTLVMDNIEFTEHSKMRSKQKTGMEHQDLNRKLINARGILMKGKRESDNYQWIGIINEQVLELAFTYEKENVKRIITIMNHTNLTYDTAYAEDDLSIPE